MLAAGTALLLALTVCYAVPTVQALAKPAEDPEALDPFSTLDMMAAEDPECLYFYDESLCADSRMFPGTEYGIPANLLFWGGWTFRSPEYMKWSEPLRHLRGGAGYHPLPAGRCIPDPRHDYAGADGAD